MEDKLIDYLINNEIKFSQILLIDENGNKIGIVTNAVAQNKAERAGLDLVCVNSKTSPAVCKILDFNKFRYELKMKEKEAKKKQVHIEVKEIQLRPNIATNDLNVKIKKAREELLKGNKIKISLSFKGREISHPELGFNIVNTFINSLSDISTIFKKPNLENRKIEAMIIKNKSKNTN